MKNQNKRKKILCLLLAVCLMFAAAGCKTQTDPAADPAQSGNSAAAKPDGTQDGEGQTIYEQLGLEEITQDDTLYAQAEAELPAIAQLLAYQATYPNAFKDVDKDEQTRYQYEEDFWTVAAMAVIVLPPEGAKDPYAYTHVERNVLLDYALALIPLYAETGEEPAMDNIYGVSDNPRSDIIDLEWISFGVTPEIVLMGRLKGTEDLLLRVHLEDEDGMIKETDWDCVVRPWSDGKSHALPLQVRSYSPSK
ncbi:MAG: hypothetical protein J5555_08760 [Firmicutes bacterium]|nr:hypothetical protein [Bacillota bacterium]